MPTTILSARYTDSRGTFKYEACQIKEQNLPCIMANKSGLNKNNLIIEGYRENQLLNKCAKALNSTKEENQINRHG